MKIIHVKDFRHYSRDKVNKPEEQNPSLQGKWEAETLAHILKGYGFVPNLICASVQPRAYKHAKLVADHCDWLVDSGWSVDIRSLQFQNFNDIKSDPAAKPLIPKIKGFAQMEGVSVETALLMIPDARRYMWKRSIAYFEGLKEVANLTRNGASAIIFSHGGQVELRFLRLLLLSKGIDLAAQSMDMVDIADLKKFGGMLRTGEGFTYDLSLDDEGNIVYVAGLGTIRLPQYPG